MLREWCDNGDSAHAVDMIANFPFSQEILQTEDLRNAITAMLTKDLSRDCVNWMIDKSVLNKLSELGVQENIIQDIQKILHKEDRG